MIPYAVYIFTHSTLSITWILKARWKRFYSLSSSNEGLTSSLFANINLYFRIARCPVISETAGNFQAASCYGIDDRRSVSRWRTGHLRPSDAKSQYRGEGVSENQFNLYFCLVLCQTWISFRVSHLKLKTSLWHSSDKCPSRADILGLVTDMVQFRATQNERSPIWFMVSLEKGVLSESDSVFGLGRFYRKPWFLQLLTQTVRHNHNTPARGKWTNPNQDFFWKALLRTAYNLKELGY